ncbi:hypothetical protein [Tsukamurella soli]|uniref:Ig-like domain-containing protein n=1 Tax=Tsukamurella soli TaxID=644556 RepID=A0ABP8J155_9ACTN
MNIFRITAIAVALLAGLCGAAPSYASTDDPTVGDTVVYTFYSDVPGGNGLTWFNADGDISQLESANLPRVASNGRYWGTESFTSRSTYQPVVGSIQTGGYFAGCTVSVDGTVIGTKTATGRFAIASCSSDD